MNCEGELIRLEVTPYGNIKISIGKGKAKITVKTEFLRDLLKKIQCPANRRRITYIFGSDYTVEVPRELHEVLLNPKEVLEIAEKLNYKTDTSEWSDKEIRRRWKNYIVYGDAGELFRYVYTEELEFSEEVKETEIPHKDFRCYMGWREPPLGTGEASVVVVPLDDEELTDQQLTKLMEALKVSHFSEETIDFRIQEQDR